MSELENQKRGTRAAVIGSAAGLIPAISLAFYWFLSQEPNVAAQRVGYVAWALLLLSPYVLALVASKVREPGVRGGLLLGVSLLSLVGSFSTVSLIAFSFLPATFAIWFAVVRSLTVARRPLATVTPATVAGLLIAAIVGLGFFSLLWMQSQDPEVRCWVLTQGPDGHSRWESRPNVGGQGTISVGPLTGGERSTCINGIITNSEAAMSIGAVAIAILGMVMVSRSSGHIGRPIYRDSRRALAISVQVVAGCSSTAD